MSDRIEAPALRWLEDFQDCLEGAHGAWWQQRAEREVEDGDPDWQDWRQLREIEIEPREATP